MKKRFCLLFVVAVCVLASSATFAQTTAVSEQKFDELVNEVRQLRIEVQRLSASAQRMQLLLERTRSQQEIVTRTTQQLNNAREQLTEIRMQQSHITAAVDHAEKQNAAGLKSEPEVKQLLLEKEIIKQREQTLMQRELQLSSDLQAETVMLNDLKTRLDKLENEIAVPSSEPAKKRE
ncbi:MAG: hypothetical protein JNM09_18030 [Blastocatellia bacterium]|nr:hypothetical protein [Blastocatellia bacterium]